MPLPARRFCADVAELDRLAEGWRHVRRSQSSAGLDGITPAQFRANADESLLGLRDQILRGQYRPSPLRRVLIPKPTGGHRMLGVATVVDRIVQGAAAIALGQRFAAGFSPSSFAYRVGRGPKEAVRHLQKSIRTGRWVVVADIEKFFDSVDHTRLLELLAAGGVDPEGCAFLLAALRATVIDRGYRLQTVRGLPQGSPASPVLANIFLNGFDHALAAQGLESVRYADDFVVVTDSEAAAGKSLRFIDTWLSRERGLRLKPAKVQFVPAEAGCVFVGFRIEPGARAIPEPNLERFRRRVTAIFSVSAREQFGEVVKEHNAFVAGWRAYYANDCPVIDRQLGELETWRLDATNEFARQSGLPDDILRHTFDRLTAPPPAADENAVGYAAPRAPVPSDPVFEVHEPWHTGIALAERAGPFSSPKALRAAALAHRQSPSVFTDGELRVPTHGAFLTRRGGLFAVRRSGQNIFECTDTEVRHITLTGYGVSISTTALIAAAERDVGVLICNGVGAPVARLTPVRSETRVGLLSAQVAARDHAIGLDLARCFLDAKMMNQRALLLYYSKYGRRETRVRTALVNAAGEVAKAVAALPGVAGVPPQEVRNRLLIIEARAAGYYWSALAKLLDGALHFPGRKGRGATDPVNMLFNYGYAILVSRVWWAIERHDLHPFLGFLHSSRRRSAGLVFDLMEEFRAPVVDRAILGLLGRGLQIGVARDGSLTLRTRRRLERAIKRRLSTSAGRGDRSLGERVVEQARRVRETIATGERYRGYRASW